MPKEEVRVIKTLVKETAEEAMPLLEQFGIKPEAFNRIALNALMSTPQIALCSPPSLRAALLRCAEAGIMPDGQSAAIIPTKSKGVVTARLDIMIGGMLDKVRQEIPGISFRARCIWEGEEFEYIDGLEPQLTHIPSADAVHNEENLVAAYAIVRLPNNAEREFEFLYKLDIERYRSFSPMKSGGIWRMHYGEMAEKTVGKLLLKRLPIRSSVKALIFAEDGEDFAPRVEPKHPSELSQSEGGNPPKKTQGAPAAKKETNVIETDATDVSPPEEDRGESQHEIRDEF